MNNSKTFAVIGGDLRQACLAGLLAADGCPVYAVGFDRDVAVAESVQRIRSAIDAVAKSDCVVLPLPFSADGATVNAPFSRVPIPLEEIWGAAREGQLVTGGKFTESVYIAAEKNGFTPVDYYEREELEILNTVPTAEGAIQTAMEELPITLHGANCLVTGFGRVSKMLCRDLQGLGAHVYASARRYADLAWIRALGYTPVPHTHLENEMKNFDVVFNTVPAPILSESLLQKLKGDCLVIDLASKPGGVDFETAGRLGIKTIWALSLPGKVAPWSSGAIIKNTVVNILAEEGLK